ncbi:hypothetical protein DFH06DRAFT_1184461 [Mycena polygramma]|nr:hypothetical protein DFH06DRAFT_1184461 [Mycena polygramma]
MSSKPRRTIPFWLKLRIWLYLRPIDIFFTYSYFLRILLRSPHRFKIARLVLWPIPWRLPIESRLSVQDLQQTPGIVQRRRDAVEMTVLRGTWIFCLRDTPLRVLYRLYECTVDYNANEMMMDSQYMFHEQAHWRLADIPDPRDPDPIRYAILASLAEDLVDSFNYKITMGLRRGITLDKPWLIGEFKKDPHPPLESAPSWTSAVGPLSQFLQLSAQCRATPSFERRNIQANMNQLRNF